MTLTFYHNVVISSHVELDGRNTDSVLKKSFWQKKFVSFIFCTNILPIHNQPENNAMAQLVYCGTRKVMTRDCIRQRVQPNSISC